MDILKYFWIQVQVDKIIKIFTMFMKYLMRAKWISNSHSFYDFEEYLNVVESGYTVELEIATVDPILKTSPVVPVTAL